MNDSNNDKSFTKKNRFWFQLLCVALVTVLFYFMVQNSYFSVIFKTLEPITLGLIFAYLINPLMMQFERLFLKLFRKAVKKEKTRRSLCRGISIALSLILSFSVITLIVYMILPELFISISGLVKDLPAKIESTIAWYNQTVDSNETLRAVGDSVLTNIQNWVNNIDTNWIMSTAKMLTTGVFSAVGTTLNVIVGIITSVYILFSKEHLVAQIKKLLYAFMEKKRVEYLIVTTREGHRIMSRFITGKIIDSAIIGVLCFVLMMILRLPYQLLVSVIVGVTNIIPYFGPFIGAIPSAMLILLTDPLKGLYFIVMILVLQQVDGNLIGPKILGDSTGLSAFWVMFAIIVGGGLFGFAGMVVGVPVLATIFYILREISNTHLAKKNLPTAVEKYTADSVEFVTAQLDSEPDTEE